MINSFFYFSKNRANGLTVLEIIVVLGILMLLTAASVVSLSSYRDRQVLNGESAQVLSILNKARSQTLASKSQMSYGVRIESDRATLYTGPVFDSVPADREEYILHHSVTASNILLAGGGGDILFDRLTGETASYGTFRIELAADPLQYHIILIKQTGLVEKEN
ncbi:MAG: type II secretion system protein [Candidatus Paceibacterota bacterium]|jgi:type II secretory pathway pseudopilin PulG|nr:type II secretion system GspH family protein [Candidatus Paceibacterota bacterium]